MMACPQHTFQVLTKRPENLESKLYGVTEADTCRTLGGGDYLPNLWIGVSVETQEQADTRIRRLLRIPAELLFLSMRAFTGISRPHLPVCTIGRNHIGWVIVGGESGPGFREMKDEWAISIRDECEQR